MTIKEFFKDFRDTKMYDIVLYNCNDDSEYNTNTDSIEQLVSKEGLENAEIVNWHLRNNIFYIDVNE